MCALYTAIGARASAAATARYGAAWTIRLDTRSKSFKEFRRFQ